LTSSCFSTYNDVEKSEVIPDRREQMAEALRIFTEPWDVKRRLRELGLTVEILINAVERSFASWAACTPNDPLNFPAIAGWAAAIRSLGDDLAPKGWMRVEDVGQPLIVNANQTIALTVASCDENTGRVDEFQPRTKASKGPRTLEKVQNNAYLFPEMEEDRDARIQAAISRSTNTWMLLIHRDLLAGEVRCELSVLLRSTRKDTLIHGRSESS
jgi:hypothetical protein